MANTETSSDQRSNAASVSPVRKPKQDATHIVWLDMEMTGLEPDQDRIIELAMMITDSQLNVLAVSDAIAVHQSDAVLEGMDQWNKTTHGRSGLVERVKASAINERAAELAMLEFMKPWVAARSSPMAGNSICQDRRFMARYMPELERYFHYRNLDVSTIKELCKRWEPDVAKSFKKRSKHTAIADIEESIDELRHYRQHFFINAPSPLPASAL